MRNDGKSAADDPLGGAGVHRRQFAVMTILLNQIETEQFLIVVEIDIGVEP